MLDRQVTYEDLVVAYNAADDDGLDALFAALEADVEAREATDDALQTL